MDTNNFNMGINAYKAPAVKVIRVRAQSFICTSPTEDEPQGSATSEGYTEEGFVW